MCMEPNFSNFSRKNDTAVRHWARKLTLKYLELLKACKVVIERYDKIPELNPKVTNWDANFDRKFSTWKITHGRFLNLKESCLPKPAKDNSLKDFCLAKGLAKQDEIWEGCLRESLEQKESLINEIYEALKISKSKKKKIELKKFCQETLIKGIANPKACQATQEQEICKKIRNMKTDQFEDNLL